MARNQKLAPLLAGRPVAAVEPPALDDRAPVSRFVASPAATWHVRFGDGSALAVRTDGSAPQGADQGAGGKVASVEQKGTTLTLALEGGKAVVFRTAESAGCVMLRDAKGAMEYAD